MTDNRIRALRFRAMFRNLSSLLTNDVKSCGGCPYAGLRYEICMAEPEECPLGEKHWFDTDYIHKEIDVEAVEKCLKKEDKNG